MVYLYVFLGLLMVLFLTLAIAWRTMVWMPGRSFRGAASPLDQRELQVRDSLVRDLQVLADDIGERNVSQRYEQLVAAAAFIEDSLGKAGYQTRRQEFTVGERAVCNIDVQCTGSQHPDDIVIVGAHYDTVPGSPGANDNGSAVVANLALARAFALMAPARTIRFAFFVNEELPYAGTEDMGSMRYAQQCRAAGENIVGMICLETIGFYSDEPSTQRYPVSALGYLYPTTGDFIAVIGNVTSRRLVHRVVRGLRRTEFPTQGMAAPRFLKDIFRSDHASFWNYGYPALMITDTANFRYRHYHTAEDTVEKINFTALARVVNTVQGSLAELAGASELQHCAPDSSP